MQGTADSPVQLRFTADSRRLVASSAGGRLRIWENKTGKLLHDYDGRAGAVERVALDADRNILAFWGRGDDAIHLWDAATGKELHRFGGHRTGPLAVAFTADGRFALSASYDTSFSIPPKSGKDWSLRRWDARTGNEMTIAEQRPKSALLLAAFAADGSLAATAEQRAGRMRIFRTDTGKEQCSGRLPTRTTTVRYPMEVQNWDVLNAYLLAFAPMARRSPLTHRRARLASGTRRRASS